MARQNILGISLDENGIGYLLLGIIMSKNLLTVILDNNKFNRTNYTDWLRNLRIVLDYENQGYIMDKPLPQILPDGSSSEERETFERWYADHRKVRSIILASMSNDVQKQYDRLDDVASILQRMKEMLSLVEKIEDLKAGLDNDTYIDVILQSLPPSFDPFIVNFNMNGLEKSINELINMLVQYEATIKKYAPSVLIGEASTSEAKGKRVGRWKRKKGKAKAKTVVVAKDAKSAPVVPVGMGKGKKRMGTQQQSRANDICAYCREKGHWKRDCTNLSSDQGMFVVEVLQRSRKLSKDDVVLRLGDGKAVAAEAVGIINLVVSDHVRLELKDCYFVPSMIKNVISIPLLDNAGFEFLINKNCFYLMKDGSSHLLGKLNNGLYILQRMKRLVDSKSLEIDNLDNLPACESCLKGKMTKKPFVGQSKLANGLLDLIHTDICGPLNTQAENSGLKLRTKLVAKIKTLRSDRGGEYLSGEFIDYLKENGIVSQWTPPGMPQLNGVAKRRNRTLLDLIRSMMTFTELPLSFWGYALETVARLLNIAPSKTVAQTPYQIWHGKPASYKYLRVWGSPAYVKMLVGDKLDSRSSLCRFIDTRRDELLLEESSEAPQSNAGTSFAPDVSTDNVPILLRSAKVPQPPERYGFLGVTGQLDNDPKTYGEAMSDIDSRKSLEAMKSKMDSMRSNQVKTLMDRPKGIRPVASWYDYEIWQMDVKTAFLNGFVEEEIYMDQPEGFTIVGEDQKKVSGSSILFLVLYVDNILLIGNDIKMLGTLKHGYPLNSP
ncbi:Retrovirus-related Pol polyprotein from transposon TNT 1-94 [Sesamum angolense]|uniref:Retrovirus-related Pol polyprotein from transposon TNT 1-94 n=1 Tax=Sesamum angolense TaxID=2727404 RepID=A0AAE1WAP8_9LAMI|nr:Retrovirus-related Pol polyprotein from transposon TNT 1-94 [Sesamum angolense]